MNDRSLEEVEIILIEIFPTFSDQLEKEDEKNDTLHGLFNDFIYYFGQHKDQFTKKQITNLAKFINTAVEVEDDLENAISTCFLEHLSQINAISTIKPLLSNNAKMRLHA